ncbi:hypothetical protein D3C86_1960890 [compost metagenome]
MLLAEVKEQVSRVAHRERNGRHMVFEHRRTLARVLFRQRITFDKCGHDLLRSKVAHAAQLAPEVHPG